MVDLPVISTPPNELQIKAIEIRVQTRQFIGAGDWPPSQCGHHDEQRPFRFGEFNLMNPGQHMNGLVTENMQTDQIFDSLVIMALGIDVILGD